MKKHITWLAAVVLLLTASFAWGASATPTVRIVTTTLDDAKCGDAFTATLELDYTGELDADPTFGTAVTTASEPGSFDVTLNGNAPGEDDDEGFGFTITAAGALSGTPKKVGTYNFIVRAQGTYQVDAPTDENPEATETRYATVARTLRLRVTAYAPTPIHAGTAAAEDRENADAGPDNFMETPEGTVTYGKKGVALTPVNSLWTKATTPITYTVTGLPKGLTLVPDPESGWNAEDENGASKDIEFKIVGNPTADSIIPLEAGIFKSIVLTVTNSAGSKTSKAYTLIVFDKPKMTTKKLPDIIWGTPYSTKVDASGGLLGYPISWDQTTTSSTTLAAAGLPGFSFDLETGRLYGTLLSTDKVNTPAPFENSKDITIELSFKPKSPAGDFDKADSDPDDYPVYKLNVKVKAVKPAIVDKSTKQLSLDEAVDTSVLGLKAEDGKIDGEGKDNILTLYADGPGTFTWWADNLPDGIESDDAEESAVYGNGLKLKAQETAAKALRKHPITIHVKNSVGEDKMTVQMSLGIKDGEHFAIKSTGTLPSGAFNVLQKVGDAAAELPFKASSLPANKKEAPEGAVKLEAFPGPITWTVKNLPKGLKLSIDKSVSFDTTAYLLGSFDKAFKRGEYTITAANKIIDSSDLVSGEVAVYEAPSITTKSFSNLMLGKKYNAKIIVKNAESVDVDIVISGDAGGGALPARRGAVTKEGDDWASKDFFIDADGAYGKLTFDATKLTLSGSFDRFPATGSDTFKVTIKARNAGYTTEPSGEGESATADMAKAEVPLVVKGVAPVFKTLKIDNFRNGDDELNHKIKVTGTQPITVKAYIARADARKMGFVDSKTGDSIDIAVTNSTLGGGTSLPAKKKAEAGDNAPTFTATVDFDEDDEKITVIELTNDFTKKFSLTGVPITISLDNGTGKDVVKVYKVNVEGNAPAWISGDAAGEFENVSRDLTVYVPITAAGTKTVNVKLTVSGDRPYEITVSPKKKDGMEATVTAAAADAAGFVTIANEAGATQKKETKTPFTLTVTNTVTKQKTTRKVTIVAMMPPAITTKGKALVKEVEFPKTVNLKVAATGTKPITWHTADSASDLGVTLEEDAAALTPLTSVEDLVARGLSLDKATGTLRGTPLFPTSDDSTHEYKPIYVLVVASNDAGKAGTVVTIGVKGKKPKITTKVVTLNIGATQSDDLAFRSDIPTTYKAAYVRWKINTKPSGSPFSDLVVADSSDQNLGFISNPEAMNKATKGLSFKVSADNVGTTVIGAVKLIVRDKTPSFDAAPTTVTGTSDQKKAVSIPAVFTLKDDGEGKMGKTGDTTLKWAIGVKPTGRLTAAIKPAANGESATVTITVPKGLSSKDIGSKTDKVLHTYFTVTATNTITKAQASMKVSVDITPYDAGSGSTPSDGSDLPEMRADGEEAAEAEADEELKQGEGTVTYGDARNDSALTQSELRKIAEGGYIIAAILPEITADDSGQYDLEAVSLDEKAPVDGELVWFAFPRNAEDSEDDLIAEFYDEAGAEVFAVPEGRVVVPAPWLEKDVTYAPVIAVKAPVAGNAKDSLDNAAEGDTVTEKALEEAAEAPAEE